MKKMLENGLKRSILIVLSLLFSFTGGARELSRREYIEKYKDIAVMQMNKHKIPASIILAQACLESSNGNSNLAVKANNHFGIKCHDAWKGKRFKQDDDKKNECFRKYESVYDSFTDHSYFLTGRSRYASLFDLPVTDYKGWAHGLKAAGYATNPKYAKLLIDIIEEYELYKYDNPESVKTSRKALKKSRKIEKLQKRADKREKKAEKARAKLLKHTSKGGAEQGTTLSGTTSPSQVDNAGTVAPKGRVHIVKAGDTLYSIARKNGLSVEDILNLNKGIKANSLKIGTEIKLD